MADLKKYASFSGLLIFGNIENLILASKGAVAHVNPFILGGLSLITVIIWLLLGTYGTKIAIKYADYIEILIFEKFLEKSIFSIFTLIFKKKS